MAKVAMTAPVILAEGIDEYLLENGKTVAKDVYDRLWNPKKETMNLKAYQNIGTQIPNHLTNKRTHSGKIRTKK